VLDVSPGCAQHLWDSFRVESRIEMSERCSGDEALSDSELTCHLGSAKEDAFAECDALRRERWCLRVNRETENE